MWISILADAASDAPPKVPYEFFGVVASAMIAGITAVMVAIIQRTKRSSNEAAPDAGSRPFVLSETDWHKVRDRSLTTESGHQELVRRFEGHVTESDDEREALRREVDYIKGQLGIR